MARSGFSVGVTIRNNLLPSMPANVRRYGQEIAEQGAYTIQANAKANILRYDAYDTGALYEGVQVEEMAPGRYQARSTRDVPGDDPNVPSHINYGTTDTPARPYWDQAVEDTRPEFYRDAAQGLEGALKGQARVQRFRGPRR